MTTAMMLAEERVNQLDAMHLFYCNELAWRCSRPDCKDCSTAVSDICNHSGANINACGNSFSLADWCFDTPRPDWFSEMFGHDLPGTYISYEAAQEYECMGFRGSNWGRNVDSEGDGHVEWVMGKKSVGRPKLTWGAHSHASGVGFDEDGLDTHQLKWFAIPPHFLPFMVPAPPIDWDYLKDLEGLKKRVSARRQEGKHGVRITGSLKRGDKGKDVLMVARILHAKGYLSSVRGDGFGWRMVLGVKKYKAKNGWPKKHQDGTVIGASMMNSLYR